jgi:hypothetical protein
MRARRSQAFFVSHKRSAYRNLDMSESSVAAAYGLRPKYTMSPTTGMSTSSPTIANLPLSMCDGNVFLLRGFDSVSPP